MRRPAARHQPPARLPGAMAGLVDGHYPPGSPARTRRAGRPRAGWRAEREAIHGPDARLLQPRPQGPAAQEHSAAAATRNVLSGLLEPDAGITGKSGSEGAGARQRAPATRTRMERATATWALAWPRRRRIRWYRSPRKVWVRAAPL